VTVDLDIDLPGVVVDDDERDGVLATAVFDATRTYRYLLTRIWDIDLPVMTWVMLNPSTADALRDDPTITRITHRTNGFARRPGLGVGGIRVVNLFALRATDPDALRTHPDPVGPLNDVFVRQAVAGASLVVCAWGAGGVLRGRATTVTRRLTRVGARPHCLGVTSTGQPRHPLYLPGAAVLAPYEASEAVA
jgi:hypothetical protein